MIYFDSIRPALSRMDDMQCGALFRGLIDYAENGVVPELDPLAGMAFDLLKPGIDRDAERYEESCEQRRYAVYCREQKKAGEEPLNISEWRTLRSSTGDIGPISPDIGRYPTTTPTTTPTPTSTTNSISMTTTATAGKGTSGGCKGDREGEPPPYDEEFEKKRQEAKARLREVGLF